MRVIVTGGRHYSNYTIIKEELDKLPPDTVIVHGDCFTGADRLAENYWKHYLKRVTEPHPAHWERPCDEFCHHGPRRRRKDGTYYCPRAGNLRNQLMVDLGADLVIAFPGGSGTHDCIQRASKAGIKVNVVGMGTIFS